MEPFPKPRPRPTWAHAHSLEGMAGIGRYFAWAGFRAPDLVLHVIETDDRLREIRRAFLVDFADLSLPVARPERPHRYLRLEVPSELFRHVLRYGLSWQELGARARLSSGAPTGDLWAHFSHRLPAVRLPWNAPANDVDAPRLETPVRQSR